MWGRYLPHIPPLSLASSQMKMQIVPDSPRQLGFSEIKNKLMFR